MNQAGDFDCEDFCFFPWNTQHRKHYQRCFISASVITTAWMFKSDDQSGCWYLIKMFLWDRHSMFYPDRGPYLFSSKRLMRSKTLDCFSRVTNPLPPPLPPLSLPAPSSMPCPSSGFWTRLSGDEETVTGLWRCSGFGGTDGRILDA